MIDIFIVLWDTKIAVSLMEKDWIYRLQQIIFQEVSILSQDFAIDSKLLVEKIVLIDSFTVLFILFKLIIY